MVAYIMERHYRGPVRRKEKRQMVCALRDYNPQVGVPFTLYGGMQGRKRVKLLDPDPVCTSVLPILMTFDRNHPEIIKYIRVAGDWLDDEEIERFAEKEGFAVNYPEGTARWRMGDVWQAKHGFEDFYGLLIEWEPHS
ncbi:MAG: hypothetical protein KGJ57_18360 [Sphingomonadales bacterium]|nr:hypothetical protein [Sphingomonadales bacterium]MDE2171363.1 hypothetical protein [Sphingomonadales bacterium]